MPKKFICNFTKEELSYLYEVKGLSLNDLCKIVGCKSTITMSRVLSKYGIDTNHNQRLAYKKKGNRTDAEFKAYLVEEYINKKRSMSSIAKEMNISHVIVERYLSKYGIPKRTKSEQQSWAGGCNWKGGRHIASNGYIEIYYPNHPKANKRKYVYEHILVAEAKLGRPLAKDEVVHHIDMDKTNNLPNNLLVLTNSEHAKLHSLLRHGTTLQDAFKEINIII